MLSQRWTASAATEAGAGTNHAALSCPLGTFVADNSNRIFIIEGLATVAIGLVAKWWVPDWPETASFLNEQERAILTARLANDQGECRMDRLDRNAVKRSFGDWKMYCAVLMYFGIVNNG